MAAHNESFSAWFNLGHIHFKQGHHDSAYVYLSRAAAIDTKHARVL
ncbi:MAG: tetratricopeptide repeat protein, partial [candidate division Zixibacteria bacterium]|nr:tetratricopeptide repeat protein [candidate division Zixibacteria bacterium]